MNLELTDRVRAETANESSSERAPGDSTGFPPWGEGGGALFITGSGRQHAEVTNDANESLTDPSPSRLDCSPGRREYVLPPGLAYLWSGRCHRLLRIRGQKRESCSSGKEP